MQFSRPKKWYFFLCLFKANKHNSHTNSFYLFVPSFTAKALFKRHKPLLKQTPGHTNASLAGLDLCYVGSSQVINTWAHLPAKIQSRSLSAKKWGAERSARRKRVVLTRWKNYFTQAPCHHLDKSKKIADSIQASLSCCNGTNLCSADPCGRMSLWRSTSGGTECKDFFKCRVSYLSVLWSSSGNFINKA